jgi:hypothetical protein
MYLLKFLKGKKVWNGQLKETVKTDDDSKDLLPGYQG